MIKRALAFLLFFASPALAVPVEVTSGEHEGFTRVVLNFGEQTDWQFGRTLDGYRFRPIEKSGEYDLEPVFDRIGKSRLAAISANAETSELDIGFACSCHAIAFEFRPGIIVIDLRDGPPPEGSSFEEPLAPLAPAAAAPAPTTAADLQANATARPAALTYNWLDRLKPTVQTPSLAPKPSSQPDLQPLREQLLRQLSRGATEGFVDLALPQTEGEIPPKAKVEAARVGIGELGGITTKTAQTRENSIGAEGETCVAQDQLDIPSWGSEEPTAMLLSAEMPSLVGEFDAPIPEAVLRATRTRLFLGFGSEARQVLQAFPNVVEGEPVLMGLSFIVDGEADPSGAFVGQGACAGSAALWASLSDPQITQLPQVNADAVVLAFSALPNHLRSFLGPELIDRFLKLGDKKTATTLQNILTRTGVPESAEVVLAQAKIDLAKGEPAAAERQLDESTAGVSMVSAQTEIARVEARTAQGLPIEENTVTALEAMQSEMVGTEIAPEIDIALIHARAASGDFEAAFAAAAEYPNEAARIWRTLANLADDSTLLMYAVAEPETQIKGLDRETSETISRRLLDLGLPDGALNWAILGGIAKGVLLGNIHLARRDGTAAILAVEDDTSKEADALRAKALTLLGDFSAAAQSFEPVSTPDRLKSLARAKDWQGLAGGAPSEWTSLAQNLTAQPRPASEGVDTFGPLARGLSLVEKSAATRSEIEKLLSNVPPPSNPQP